MCLGHRLHRLAPAVLALGLALLAWPAHAGGASVAFAHDDAALKWGPCPEFMPQGCGIAVLHGDPGKSNADVFFKVPAGSAIPLHWHTSAERMVLVSGEMHVRYEREKPVVLRTGTYAYGPAKKPHDATCAEGAPCVLFIAFESPVDAVAGKPPAP